MGAIAVFFSRHGPPNREVVLRMLAAAPHRGERRTVETLGRVAVGVCNDPDWMTASIARTEGRLAVFGGVLDNEQDLRAELGLRGAALPAASTPAATLMAAFERWGEDAVVRLRGSFAAAITDGRTLQCFRDHFGTRPLFHHDGPGGFFAATEVKQVLAGARLAREPDMEYLHALLYGGLDRATAYRGVERVREGTLATVTSERGLRSRPYWDPAACVETTKLGLDDAVAGTRAALGQAVRRMLTGRDAILLSGGLDSPALAAFAADAEPPCRPVQSLTAVYPSYPAVDESSWTQMAADHLGMPLHRYEAEAASLDRVDWWVNVLDGPIDILSIPESAEAYGRARDLGARTVFSGEIAEMLFHCRGDLLTHLLSHGRARAAVREVRGQHEAGRSRRQIAMDIVRGLAPPLLRSAYRRIRGHAPRPPDWFPGWIDYSQVLARWRSRPSRPPGPRHRWKAFQVLPLTGPTVAFEADEICAATCGVDCRRPFADVDLWEFVLSLPAETKFPDRRTKPLLRRAMRGLLPDDLIDRRDKTYFTDFHLANAQYPELRRLLVDSDHRLDGIDYAQLEERLDGENMAITELQWARNVARIHAFLNQW